MLTLDSHRVDQPDARPGGAGADVSAADHLLFDLRDRLRQSGQRADHADPRRRRRRGPVGAQPPPGRGLEEGKRPASPDDRRARRRRNRRSIAPPPSGWCAMATCPVAVVIPRGLGEAFGQIRLRRRARDRAARRSVRSNRAQHGRRAAAEGHDDGGAGSDDAGRHQAVRDLRGTADAAAASRGGCVDSAGSSPGGIGRLRRGRRRRDGRERPGRRRHAHGQPGARVARFRSMRRASA